MSQECPVCRQSILDRAVLFEDDVWLHARCWRPLRRFLEQTEERERIQDARNTRRES